MERFLFANQLRGIAALMVVISHYVVVYWGLKDVVSYVTGSPSQSGSAPEISYFLTSDWFNMAALGVALFFLISGFVIPFSLKEHDAKSFVMARALRIYPPYIIGLLIQIGIVHLSSLYQEGKLHYSLWQILANMALVHNLLQVSSIDLVNWTLTIELKFYLVALLLRGYIVKGKLMPLLVFSAAVFIVNYGTVAYYSIQPMPIILTYRELMFISYMTGGVMFNYHIRGLITTKQLAFGSLANLALFSICWKFGVAKGEFDEFGMNYIIAFFVFSAVYCMRNKAKKNIIIDWLANVSYPIYLVHSTVGYVIMRMMMVAFGFSFWTSFSAAIAASFAIAWTIHLAIETKTIAYGRKLKERAKLVAAASTRHTDAVLQNPLDLATGTPRSS